MFRFLRSHHAVRGNGVRRTLRDHASSVLFVAGQRISPTETVRFAEHITAQLKPQPTSGELITAFLNGGIPAVITQLS